MPHKKEVPNDVAYDVISALNDSVRERTKAAEAQTRIEEGRKQELVAIHGDIQGILVYLGELGAKIDAVIVASEAGDQEIATRLIELERFQKGFSLYVGKELREDMHNLRTAIREVGELAAKALRGWTDVAMQAESQGVDVLKPPGYRLGE